MVHIIRIQREIQSSTVMDFLVLEIKKVQYSVISLEEEVIFPLPRKMFHRMYLLQRGRCMKMEQL